MFLIPPVAHGTDNGFQQPRPRLERPAGLTVLDVIVLLFVGAVFALVVLMSLTRTREQARLSACQKNLSQIGLALALYHHLGDQLPMIGKPETLDGPMEDQSPGPLKLLLQSLGQADFRGLAPDRPAPGPTDPVPGEIPVPGFVCSSDPHATAGLFRAPISYRACTGTRPTAQDGAFVPGRLIGLKEIEQGDGASYTAAFSERLVGDDVDGHVTSMNYAVAAGPLPDQGCSLEWLGAQGARWRGDAGASWIAAGYRCTLYNHALKPGSSLSCVAWDGQSAFMGASSGHTRGINLLMLDGAVKLVQPSIDFKVWRDFASITEPADNSQEK